VFFVSYFLLFAFFLFATVLSTIVFFAMFLSKFLSCFFQSSLTFISDNIKQKNSKKQETENKKHIVE